MWSQRETRANPGDPKDLVDIYAVGVLRMIITMVRIILVKGITDRRKKLRNEWRREWNFIWSYCIKNRNWRSLRNTFNGYLAEHRHGHHNAGIGWTKNRAFNHSMVLCHEAACMRFHPDEVCVPGRNHPGVAV